MAIYAVQGLYAAGCLAMAYPLYRWVLNPSFLANREGALTDEKIKSFVREQAKEMGVKKEIVVIQGQNNDFSSYGNTWFSGKVGIELPEELREASWKFNITHQIAHIKANDALIIRGAVLAAALFTTLVLAVNSDLFTGYLGGMGAGLITGVVLSRRCEKKADQEAMHYCSQDVNQAYLNALLKDKKNGFGRDLRSWIFWPVEPSLDEKIGYLQAHLEGEL